MTPTEKSALILRLTSVINDVNRLAGRVTYSRDGTPVDSPDKATYRYIGRRLDIAQTEVEKALERLTTS